MVIYRIEKELPSPATNIIFAHDAHTNQPVCLKMWLRCNNNVYDTTDVNKCNDYFLEGLPFNRRFAPGVYLGIVPVKYKNNVKKQIRCGRMIKKPERNKLKKDCEYALVMERLDADHRLDRQLGLEGFGNIQGMEFLAETVAGMHQQLQQSPSLMGTPERLSKKLYLNQQNFVKALDQVQQNPNHAVFKQRLGIRGIRQLKSVSNRLIRVGEAYLRSFE